MPMQFKALVVAVSVLTTVIILMAQAARALDTTVGLRDAPEDGA